MLNPGLLMCLELVSNFVEHTLLGGPLPKLGPGGRVLAIRVEVVLRDVDRLSLQVMSAVLTIEKSIGQVDFVDVKSILH